MLKLTIAVALAGSSLACQNPSTPDRASITIVAEKASYSVLPQGSYATVRFDLRIRNDSDQAVETFLCSTAVQRSTDTPGEFVNVLAGGCIETSERGPRIAAHSDLLLTRSLSIEARHIDVNASYRVALPFSAGPEFRRGYPYQSAPFLLTRE